jgi:fructose-1,6-bisphosphatase
LAFADLGPASATKAVAGLSGTGRAQVAAGYIMYGPSAVFVYTTGEDFVKTSGGGTSCRSD